MGGRVPQVLQVFWDGFTVAQLNPKTALFFAAYLPQFLPVSKAPIGQTLLFGCIFVLIAATTDSVYAVAAGSLKPWLEKAEHWVITVTSSRWHLHRTRSIHRIYQSPREKRASITQSDD